MKRRKSKAIPREIIRQQIYEIFSGHCAYCGKEINITEMQIDYVKTIHIGGKDDITNYRPMCRQCSFWQSL